MCGIYGQFPPPENSSERRILDAISHRGPDSEGFVRVRNGFLAHSRLAIIDLSSRSDQPLKDDSGRYTMVYNGEIYNFKTIRDELRNLGHVFRSNGDTEVVLRGFIQWGSDVFRRLNGMFALAIYDSELEALTLARDIFGIKPLIYWRRGNRLVFSSELRPFLNHPWVPRDYSTGAISELLSFGAIGQQQTMLDSVKQLKPGSILTFSIATGKVEESVYAQIDELSTSPYVGTFGDATKELNGLLEKVVVDSASSDAELGCFLSGGLDSSILIHLLQKNSPRRIKAFSLGFENDSRFDESGLAESTARASGAEFHQAHYPDTELSQNFRDFIDAIDQPSIDGFNSYLVSKFASNFVKVAISGLGADEIFGGYRHFRTQLLSHRIGGEHFPQVPPQMLRKLPGRLAELPSLFGLEFGEIGERIRGVSIADWESSALIGGQKSPPINGPRAPRGEAVKQLSIFELENYMLNMLLRDLDAVSMRFGLEVRPPFLDKRLVSFALDLPDRFKIKRGQGKAVLREAFRAEINPEILRRRKRGFELPFVRWMNGPLQEEFFRALNGPAAEEFLTRESRESVVARASTTKLRREDWLLLVLFTWVDEKLT